MGTVAKKGFIARTWDKSKEQAGRAKELVSKAKEMVEGDNDSLWDTIGKTVAAVVGKSSGEKVGTGGMAVGGAQLGYGVAKIVTGQPGGLTHTVFGGVTASCGAAVRIAGAVRRIKGNNEGNNEGNDKGNKSGGNEDISNEQVESAINADVINVWEGASSGDAIDTVAEKMADEIELPWKQMISDEKHGSLTKGDKAQLKLLRQLARRKIIYAE